MTTLLEMIHLCATLQRARQTRLCDTMAKHRVQRPQDKATSHRRKGKAKGRTVCFECVLCPEFGDRLGRGGDAAPALMFSRWFIDGRVDGVFLLAAGVLNEFLKEVAGEGWVTEEVVEEDARPSKSRQCVQPPLPRGHRTSTAVRKVEAEPGQGLEPEAEQETALSQEVDLEAKVAHAAPIERPPTLTLQFRTNVCDDLAISSNLSGPSGAFIARPRSQRNLSHENHHTCYCKSGDGATRARDVILPRYPSLACGIPITRANSYYALTQTSTIAPDAGERGEQALARKTTLRVTTTGGGGIAIARHHPLLPLSPSVFLALGARCACVPYAPVFQGINLCVVRPLSVREMLTMCDAVSVLVRLGAIVVGTGAGGLDIRVEMWRLNYAGF
ncbi:hypothetical protein BJV74DRAFT_990677 [Russula compacta]|nr:hypothetical protein BJV74DRAFT_990677 [Russula compacta]